MITVIVTSYNEPKATERAVNTILKQKIKTQIKVLVIDPFPEVEAYLRSKIKDKRFDFILDPGEGKSYALNLILENIYSENKKDIIVFTDGDVFVSKNTLQEIINSFKDSNVGCVTGRPISIDKRDTKYGLWANIAFDRIHQVREILSNKKDFFECSGYLFAIRNGVIKEFALDASEDSIIPYLFWKKGYKIQYLNKAEVYVKNPDNWKDYLNQKVRNIKGHENLNKIVPDIPRTKSFINEIKYGALFAIGQAKNIKEFFWIIQLYFARLYIYFKAFNEMKKKKNYTDGWREVEIESTRTLD